MCGIYMYFVHCCSLGNISALRTPSFSVGNILDPVSVSASHPSALSRPVSSFFLRSDIHTFLVDSLCYPSEIISDSNKLKHCIRQLGTM